MAYIIYRKTNKDVEKVQHSDNGTFALEENKSANPKLWDVVSEMSWKTSKLLNMPEAIQKEQVYLYKNLEKNHNTKIPVLIIFYFCQSFLFELN